MQTFLPYPDFKESAKCLDYRRLGKERVECYQIYQCLTNKGSLRWKNHPAVKMWKGYEIALLEYGIVICDEWILRGYKDSLKNKFLFYFWKEWTHTEQVYWKYPDWFGNKDFHASHRSNLLRKNKEFYSKYGWEEPDNLEYIWPVK